VTDADIQVGLCREARGATLSAIAASSLKIEALLDQNRLTEAQQIAEGVEQLASGLESLAEAERALAEARQDA